MLPLCSLPPSLASLPDLLQGKVHSSWYYTHILVQLLGVLAAAGGVAVIILTFGWKGVAGQSLYAPHKWIGLAVMGMSLLQVSEGVGWGCRGVWVCLVWVHSVGQVRSSLQFNLRWWFAHQGGFRTLQGTAVYASSVLWCV
jgi:hypothetical protein